jgi:ribosome-associated protein
VAQEIAISGPTPLGSFVKLSGGAATGGEAKRLIQGGAVRLNGEIELRRGHDVHPGDLIELGGHQYLATQREAL